MNTKINKLVCRGFKSFAKRTEFVFGNDFNCVLGPNGSGKSTRWDTEVLLSDGSIAKIGPLVDKQIKNSKLIKNLDDGIYVDGNGLGVISLNPNTMKSEIKPISKFIRREGEPFLYEIKTNLGKKVVTTGCHPVMTFKNNQVKSVLVRDLKESDLIASPRKLDLQTKNSIPLHTTNPNFPNKITTEFAVFLGYLIGDGYLRLDRFEFVNGDEKVVEDFKYLVKDLFKLDYEPYERKTGNAIRLIYREREICKLLYDLFKVSYENKSLTNLFKIIPSEFQIANNDIIRFLLAGLYDTDGYVSKSTTTIEYSSKNEKLINQVQLLLLRFGLCARKEEKEKCATNTINKTKRTYYSLYLEGRNNLELFYENIPLKCLYKRDRIREHLIKDVVSNPNVDLLPLEINSIIKEIKEELGIAYKPLRKKHPKFAAYIENRCNPSKAGVEEILTIFNSKLMKLEKINQNVLFDQRFLLGLLGELGIPSKTAAINIGLSSNTLVMNWKNNLYQAKKENLTKLFDFIKTELTQKIKNAKQMLNLLTNMTNSSIFWEKIVSIKKVEGEKYVYDLTIPDNHNFVGNGIFVHNSNILDALTFVLGRRSSKSMRAEKASNLIYNGGKTKKSASDAEVEIYFDNTQGTFPIKHNEVIISRKVRMNGNSSYRINGNQVTRNDIIDMLSKARIDPDGYNIILQGDIIRFVEMATEERRQIIEEIAGIGEYEDKKKRSLSELERVEQRLKESEIILTERKTYLKELKKDRDQALEYKSLNEDISKYKATYLNVKIERKSSEVEGLDKKINEFNTKIQGVNLEISEYEKKIAEIKSEVDKINKQIETKGEKEQVKLNKEIEQSKIDFATNKQKLESHKNEIKRIQDRRKELELNNREINEKIKSLEREKDSMKKEIENVDKQKHRIAEDILSFKKKNKLDQGFEQIEKEISDIDKESEEKQEIIQKLRLEQQNALREKDQIEFKIQSLDEQLGKVAGLEQENKAQLNNLKNSRLQLNKLEKDLSKAITEDSMIAGKVRDMRVEHEKRSSELAKLESKNIQYKELSAGDRAIQSIIEAKKEFPGVKGTVSDLGSVQSKYSLALEIAAGARMKSIIVDTDSTAARCIKFLKENKSGSATFLPLNKLNVKSISSLSSALSKNPGVEGMAIDLVKFPPDLKKAFEFVLGDTLVVNNITTARNLGIGQYRMVTLDGDLLELSGAMRGGFVTTRKGLGFKEQELTASIDELQEKVFELEGLLSTYQKRRAELDNEISKTREEKANVEGEIIKLERILHLDKGSELGNFKEKSDSLKKGLKDAESTLEKALGSISKENTLLANLKMRKQDLRNKVSELRNPTILAQLKAFEDKRNELNESAIKLKAELSNFDSQINSILGPDVRKTLEIIKETEKEEERFNKMHEDLKKRMKEQEEEVAEKEKHASAFYKQFKSLFAEKDKFSVDIQKNEKHIDEKEVTIKEIEFRLNSANLDRAKLKGELEGLNTEFEEFKNVEVFKSKTDLGELQREISKLEGKRANSGNVNLRALEVYDKVEGEYNSLLEKKSVLEVEQKDVMDLIGQIEMKKKDIFMKTFDVVNTIFKDFFKQLSTKGDAFLEMENQEKPFEAGVEIKVRLSGNKFMDIKSLSGGEKTMTALAFIFAIQEHDPASFYILDEVDAALDKHNSEKLAKLIRNYCKRAQYVVISHNDAVISEATNLYGVSMNEHGMTNVTTLKL